MASPEDSRALWRLAASAANEEGDEIWQRIIQFQAARGMSEGATAQEFTAKMGFEPHVAAGSELNWYFEHLSNPEHHDRAGYSFSFGGHELGSDWIRVSGGRLSRPIDLRLAIVRGRPRVVGLHIDSGSEVLADQLREIKLGEILQTFTARYDAEGPDLSGVRFKEHEAAWEAWMEIHEFFTQDLSHLEVAEVASRRGAAPTDSDLQGFARIYREELRARSHGSVTRAARRCHIARSTAYRWLEECRDRGYIPPGDEEQS